MSSEEICSAISTRVAVFDLDGTLYDKRGLAPRMVLAQIGHLRLLKAEREVRRALAGRDFGSGQSFYLRFWNDIADRSGRTAGVVAAWYNDNYMPSMVSELSRRFSLRDWVAPVMAELRSRGVRVAVFSDYPFASQKLEALGFDLSRADAGVFDAPSLGGLKPCRESFLRLSSALGVSPEDITVIGDRADTDIEGARRAGMSSLLV